MRLRNRPARPTLGPLLACSVVAWAGVVLAEELTWLVHTGEADVRGIALGCVGIFGGVCAAAAVAVVVWHRRAADARRTSGAAGGVLPHRTVAALALAFAVALACGLLYWTAWEGDAQAISGELSGGDFEVTLVGDPAERDWGDVSVATARVGGRTVTFRLLWPDDADELAAGHVVTVSGSFSAAGDDDGGRWNHRQGYLGLLDAVSVEEAGVAGGLRGLVTPFRDASFERIEELGGDAAGLLAGILLGNRTLYAQSELEQDFRTTGLAHLMAVSGTHLAVVSVLVAWLLARLRLGAVLRCGATLVVLAFYVALTCFAPSAERSYVMCAAALVSGLAARRGHVPSALALCMLAFVCANPQTAFSTGFQLSVLSVGGLVLFAPLVEQWLVWALPDALGEIAQPVSATLSATMCTLPVTVPMFSQLPLVSPLSTLLVSPLITLALGIGIPALLCFAVWRAPAALALGASGTVANAAAALVHALADLPLACIPVQGGTLVLSVLFASGLACLWLVWPLPPDAHSPLATGDVAEGTGISDGTALRYGTATREGTVLREDSALCDGSAMRDGIVMWNGTVIQDGTVIRNGSAMLEEPLPFSASRAGAPLRTSTPPRVGEGLHRGFALACCLAAPLAVICALSFGGPAQTLTALDPRADIDATVTMIDVGQGDCTLVQSGEAAILIDCGEEDQLLLEGLARAGVTSLDAVYVSHPDTDHCGALSALAGVVGVSHVFVHETLLDTESVTSLEEAAEWVSSAGTLEGVSAGETAVIGDFTLETLGPEDAGEGENEDSLIQVLAYDEDADGSPEARVLFTGDAEEESLEAYVDDIGDIDVLKVAHHGSRGAESDEQLAILSPAVALIGVGADNTYGHPTSEMLASLDACGAEVFRTDTDGDITVAFDDTTISVGTQK